MHIKYGEWSLKHPQTQTPTTKFAEKTADYFLAIIVELLQIYVICEMFDTYQNESRLLITFVALSIKTAHF